MLQHFTNVRRQQPIAEVFLHAVAETCGRDWVTECESDDVQHQRRLCQLPQSRLAGERGLRPGELAGMTVEELADLLSVQRPDRKRSAEPELGIEPLVFERPAGDNDRYRAMLAPELLDGFSALGPVLGCDLI